MFLIFCLHIEPLNLWLITCLINSESSGILTMEVEEGYSNPPHYLINCEEAKPQVVSERNTTQARDTVKHCQCCQSLPQIEVQKQIAVALTCSLIMMNISTVTYFDSLYSVLFP